MIPKRSKGLDLYHPVSASFFYVHFKILQMYYYFIFRPFVVYYLCCAVFGNIIYP